MLVLCQTTKEAHSNLIGWLHRGVVRRRTNGPANGLGIEQVLNDDTFVFRNPKLDEPVHQKVTRRRHEVNAGQAIERGDLALQEMKLGHGWKASSAGRGVGAGAKRLRFCCYHLAMVIAHQKIFMECEYQFHFIALAILRMPFHRHEESGEDGQHRRDRARNWLPLPRPKSPSGYLKIIIVVDFDDMVSRVQVQKPAAFAPVVLRWREGEEVHVLVCMLERRVDVPRRQLRSAHGEFRMKVCHHESSHDLGTESNRPG
jgi:hypothetical protein